MGLVRVLVELAVLVMASILSFVIGAGVAVHHVRGNAIDIDVEKIEHRKHVV
jgi:hypothetical protein